MSSPWEDGDPAAKICFIAEAPARAEMREGRPLVGPSGQIFESCLHSAAIVRRASYILNLWPFEVRKSRDKSQIFNPNDGVLLWSNKRGITKEGLEDAAPQIEKLKRSGANVIVPMGNPALSALVGKNAITKWRGSILESTHPELIGRKVVPTIHPAASLHGEFTNRYLIQKDLRRIREESKTKRVRLPKRDLIVNPSFDECLAFIEYAGRHERIATDVELLPSYQISCFSIATSPEEAICIPLLDEYGRARWTEDQEVAIWLAYADLMGRGDIEKINQNILFDIVVLLRKNHIVTRGFLGDTMVLFNIMYPEFKKALEVITSIYTREPYYKDDKKLWRTPDKDPFRFWLYSCRDSATALEAWLEMRQEAEEGGFWDTYLMSVDDFPALLHMMASGVFIDGERLQVTAKEVGGRIDQKQAELDELVGRPLNVNSPKQCQEYFYVEKGIKPYINRKTGTITTDDKAMARIARRFRLREAKLVQEIRADRKLLSTYLEVLYDEDGKLRCMYNPRGTWTGRVSSSQIFERGMNLNNLHPEFKDFIVADP